MGGEEETETDTRAPITEREWTLPELAHLKGEMQALREHPATMPEYEETWARKHAEQAIQQDRDFERAGEAVIQKLTNEYLKSYTERFAEYYDTQAARDCGYNTRQACKPMAGRWKVKPHRTRQAFRDQAGTDTLFPVKAQNELSNMQPKTRNRLIQRGLLSCFQRQVPKMGQT